MWSLFDRSTNRLLVLLTHETPDGIMRALKLLCMLLPKIARSVWVLWLVSKGHLRSADSKSLPLLLQYGRLQALVALVHRTDLTIQFVGVVIGAI